MAVERLEYQEACRRSQRGLVQRICQAGILAEQRAPGSTPVREDVWRQRLQAWRPRRRVHAKPGQLWLGATAEEETMRRPDPAGGHQWQPRADGKTYQCAKCGAQAYVPTEVAMTCRDLTAVYEKQHRRAVRAGAAQQQQEERE